MQSHNFSLLEKKKIKARSLPIIVYVIPYLNDLFAALFFFSKNIKFCCIIVILILILMKCIITELIISSKPKKVKIGTWSTINVLSRRYIASVDLINDLLHSRWNNSVVMDTVDIEF